MLSGYQVAFLVVRGAAGTHDIYTPAGCDDVVLDYVNQTAHTQAGSYEVSMSVQ